MMTCGITTLHETSVNYSDYSIWFDMTCIYLKQQSPKLPQVVHIHHESNLSRSSDAKPGHSNGSCPKKAIEAASPSGSAKAMAPCCRRTASSNLRDKRFFSSNVAQLSTSRDFHPFPTSSALSTSAQTCMRYMPMRLCRQLEG